MASCNLSRRTVSLSLLVLLSVISCAVGGSIDLGRKKENAPDFDGDGFHSLSDFNDGIGLSGTSSYLVALGDFNSDKYADVFMVSADRQSLQVHTWSNSAWRFEEGSRLANKTGAITYVIPSDFDYDGLMDVMVGGIDDDGRTYNHLHVHSSRESGLSGLETGYNSPASGLTDGVVPAFLDLNGDMRMDVLGTTPTMKRAVWTSLSADAAPIDFYSLTTNFNAVVSGCATELPQIQSCYNMDQTTPVLLQPSLAVATADMDGDCVSDLLVIVDTSPCTGVSPGSRALEVWIRVADTQKLELRHVYALPAWAEHVSTQDLDRDGDLDVIILVAESASSNPHKAHFMYNTQQEMCSSQWELESSSCRPQQLLCRADPLFSLGQADCPTTPSLDFSTASGLTSATLASYEPFTPVSMLRFGDFDLDGYPDVMVGLNSGGSTSVQLWRNTHRDAGSERFQKTEVPGLSASGAFCGAFMDLDDDMSMDLIVISQSSGTPSVEFLLNDNDYDAFAVKVLGSNGVCPEWCNGLEFPDPKPYGVNYPGNTFKLTVVNTEGDKRVQIVPQLQLGSYGLSLESAATLVGLSRTNNYLEEVYMGIPFGKFMLWTNLVPNSQLVAFPHEKGDPVSWLLELFVPTDTKIGAVVVALILTLVVLAVPIGILSWKERTEDKREKLDSSHLFSYDAL